MTEGTLFAAYAKDRRLQALVGDARPAYVWSGDGRRLLWSNPAGAALLGLALRDLVSDGESLTVASLVPQIVAVARTVPRSGSARLERLRFPGLGRLETLACACRSFDGPTGAMALLITAMAVPRWLKRTALAPLGSLAPMPVHQPSGPDLDQPGLHRPELDQPDPDRPGLEAPVTEPDPPAPAAGSTAPGVWTWVPQDDGSGAGRESDPRDEATPVKDEPADVRAPEPTDPAPEGPPPHRRGPLRFVFQTDASGRFVSVSMELKAALGAAADRWTGRRFAEIVEEAGPAVLAPNAIIEAFATRDTWTGLAFEWLRGGADAVVETTAIEMSALPVFDRNRTFQGFRGFGICRPPLVVGGTGAVPLSEDDPPAAVEPGAILPPAGDLVPQAPIRAGDTSLSAPVADLGGRREAKADPKIVRLHARSGLLDRPALSPSEKNAFREIARALGAKADREATRTSPVEPPAVTPHPDFTQDDVAGSDEEPVLGADIEEWRADGAVERTGDPDPVGRLRDHLVAEARRPGPPGPPVTVPFPRAPAAAMPSVPAGLVDRLPIGIMVARGETLLYANRTMLDLVGYASLEDLRAAGGLDGVFTGKGLAGPADGPDGCQSVLLATSDGGTVAVEGRVQTTSWEGEGALLVSVRRPAGQEAEARLRAAEIVAEEATASASSAQRRASELQAVLDTATDGVIILDQDGRIVGLNRSAEALFGYEADEIADKGMLILFAPESHRAAFDYLDSLKSNGVASVLNDGREVMGRVRQGGLVPLFMTIGRLGEVDGNRFCAVLRDMTSFKKAESELMSAKRHAEEASSQKSDFLAKISHEIRTPLNAIIGFAEVMMEERFGPIGNDRYRSYARDIYGSGGHIISLVNDLLDLSKIEAGKLDLTFTSVDLNDLIQQSVATMQQQANRDRIIIRTALSHTLPNVVADSRSVRQIALNLISNSIKFTMAGGQVIISTTLSERGEAIIRVRDTGVGMTEKELAVAMEPFRQVSTSGSGGTGLGLPLTKALVEANRASFAIQSAKNTGTIVEVVFPPTRVLAE